MDYIELECILKPYSQMASEVLMAELAEINFESFTETDEGLNAYIPENLFDFEAVKKLLISKKNELCNIAYKYHVIKTKNWNEVWEKNFDPVIVNNQCIIKAPFHENTPKLPYEITIEPKMSFGTGHHETTSLMVDKILRTDIKNKSVLDMGCGTGVLAILASLRGAKKLTAVDIDDWAYSNTLENTKKNNITNITILKGGAEVLDNKKFDLIFANINLNILLSDINIYTESLSRKGSLIMSGIYKHDLDKLKNVALKNKLELIECNEKNHWIAVEFKKMLRIL